MLQDNISNMLEVFKANTKFKHPDIFKSVPAYGSRTQTNDVTNLTLKKLLKASTGLRTFNPITGLLNPL